MTWTLVRATKKKTGTYIDRPLSPRVNKHKNDVEWLCNTRLSKFSQIYLWIHHKYSSKSFKQHEWQKKMIDVCYFSVVNSPGEAWSSRLGAGGLSWRKSKFCSLCTFFFCFVFFSSYFSLWLVSLYSHWWPFTAWQDFWDNIFLVLVILAFPWIVSGEANMLFLETPFKLLPDLLDPPPYKHCMYMYM